MQRRPIREEMSRQQCSGGQFVKKYLGNNVSRLNPLKTIAATLQQKPIKEKTV